MLQNRIEREERQQRRLIVSLGRCQNEVFEEEMGARVPGRDLGIDCDRFDPDCEHLLVANHISPRNVCGTPARSPAVLAAHARLPRITTPSLRCHTARSSEHSLRRVHGWHQSSSRSNFHEQGPHTLEVYCTLTNNVNRGTPRVPGLNAANPRPGNVFGHIIRWREADDNPAAPAFKWDIFALAGDPQHADPQQHGNVKGDPFGSPDGLWFDQSGLLWIQTDVSTSTLYRGHYERMGNNQMLCADIRTGEVRRFLTGPRRCEVTGVIMTPAARTMFVNIQHPGELPGERADPRNPKAMSAWPDGPSGGRPRSATVVIRRDGGGVIGA